MKTWTRRSLLALFLGCVPVAASAAEARLGLGGAVTAFSTQVQGDMELGNRIGFQAGVGSPLFGAYSASAGGRFHFMPEGLQPFLSPYVGVLASVQNSHPNYYYDNRYYGDRRTATLLGPTLGMRLRQRDQPGLGGFLQVELMQETHDRRQLYPSLGAGVQWWF